MDLSVNNLLNLDSNKSYYLTHDNKIKESGIFHKIKCFFNIGDAREGVQRLIQAVKTTLEDNAGFVNNNALTRDLRELSTDSAASGSALKQIAARFNQKNIEWINEHKIKLATAELMTSEISDLVKASGGRIKDTPELRAIFFRGTEKLFRNTPDAMKDAEGNIDMEIARDMVKMNVKEIGLHLLELTKKNDSNIIDGLYAKYIMSESINPSHPVPFDELKSREEVFAETIKEEVVKEKRDSPQLQETIDYLKEQIKENPELALVLTENRAKILLRGDREPRTLEQVKERVANIKSETDSLKVFKNVNPKVYEFGKTCMLGLSGTKVIDGTLKAIASQALKIDISPLTSINSRSSELEIFNALMYLHERYIDITKNPQLKLIDKSVYEGRDEVTAFRHFFYSCALSRLDAHQREALMQTLDSVQNSRLVTYLDDFENNEIAKKSPLSNKHNFYSADLSQDIKSMKSCLSSLMEIEDRPINEYAMEIKVDSGFRSITDKILQRVLQAEQARENS